MNRYRKRLLIGVALVVAALTGVAAVAVAGDSGTSAAPSPAVAAASAVADAGAQADEGENESADDAADAGAEDAAEGPDKPITGPDLERASAAALAYLGEGRVTETEIEDEESYYEVEVTLDDGRQIDVQLDEQFNVVGTD